MLMAIALVHACTCIILTHFPLTCIISVINTLKCNHVFFGKYEGNGSFTLHLECAFQEHEFCH
jgi:hypothetical protein